MSTYFIGDIHGCYHELKKILIKVDFNPSKDVLWLTGDLVFRGPYSIEVLRYLKALGSCVRLVLGNQDIHLIAIYIGIKKIKPYDKLKKLLKSPDIDELINWLRQQSLLQIDESKKIIMVHAGITPQWDINTAKQCAQEFEKMLSSKNYKQILHSFIFDNEHNYWHTNLSKSSRLSFIVNSLTRIRYCFPNGKLDFLCKSSPKIAPFNLKPWFDIANINLNQYTIFFGHWSSLGDYITPKNIIGLDTGCCWGGKLTLFHLEKNEFITQKSISNYYTTKHV